MRGNTFESDFNDYVEKYAIKHQISKEAALKHQMIKDVRDYYNELYSEGETDGYSVEGFSEKST